MSKKSLNPKVVNGKVVITNKADYEEVKLTVEEFENVLNDGYQKGYEYGYEKGRADMIEECADKFAETLSNMTEMCGRNCPVKCNWGTDMTCKDMCKSGLLRS